MGGGVAEVDIPKQEGEKGGRVRPIQEGRWGVLVGRVVGGGGWSGRREDCAGAGAGGGGFCWKVLAGTVSIIESMEALMGWEMERGTFFADHMLGLAWSGGLGS